MSWLGLIITLTHDKVVSNMKEMLYEVRCLKSNEDKLWWLVIICYYIDIIIITNPPLPHLDCSFNVILIIVVCPTFCMFLFSCHLFVRFFFLLMPALVLKWKYLNF